MTLPDDQQPNCCHFPKGVLFRAILFLAVLLVLPFFIRKRSRVVRRVIVEAPPDEVFTLLNDLRNWPSWTEWSRRDEMRVEYDGPPKGVGATQRWSSARGTGEMKIIQSVENEQVAYTVDIDSGKYELDGLLVLDSIAYGTRVTWLCRWEAGPNPFSRYLDLFMRWAIGRDFQGGLENLKRLVERGPKDAKIKTGEGT